MTPAPVEEQAQVILDHLNRVATFDVPPDADTEFVKDAIDPDLPLSVNMKNVADELG